MLRNSHWGRVMHLCISKQTIISSDNGLSPGRCQAIIWTSAGTLLTEPLGTNFILILIEILTSSFKKMHLKMSGKWHPFCLSLNVLSQETIMIKIDMFCDNDCHYRLLIPAVHTCHEYKYLWYFIFSWYSWNHVIWNYMIGWIQLCFINRDKLCDYL